MDKEGKINQFLEDVSCLIADEKKAQDLKDELRDHINSKIEDLIAIGKSEELAVEQAITEMGEVKLLRKKYEVQPPTLILRKLIVLMVGAVICLASYLAKAYIEEGSIFFIMSAICIAIECVIGVGISFNAFRMLNLCKKQQSKCYIRPFMGGPNDTKKKGLCITAIIACIFLGFLIWATYEDGYSGINGIVEVLTSFSGFLFLTAFLISEYDNRYGIVYDEGIMMPNRYLRWEHIQKYNWQIINHKGKKYYMLRLQYNTTGKAYIIPRSVSVQVNDTQKKAIEQLMAMHEIGYSAYM